jgi:Site-specific recombinase XerD
MDTSRWGRVYGLEYREYLKNAQHPISYRNRPVPDPILEEDAVLIQKYLDERTALAGLKPATAKSTASYLCMAARKAPLFKKVSTTEVLTLVSCFRQDLKPNTLRRFIPVLKNFFTWLYKEGVNTHLDLEKIKAIKPPALDLECRKAAGMLTKEEIEQLIQVADHPRDKAIIAMAFESACRPGELLDAHWGDLAFDRYGAQFNTSKKTGKPRYIRLIWSAPYLLTWKNNYPDTIKNDSYLFLSLKKEHGDHVPFTHSGYKQLLRDLQNRTGIKKTINPYLMRHSRITSMLAGEVPESVVKVQCWGSVQSKSIAHYSHLTSNDIDAILLSRAGLKVAVKPSDTQIKPRQCPNCGEINTPTAKFCNNCGQPLTPEAKQDVSDAGDKVRQLLSENPTVQAVFIELVKELNQTSQASLGS